MHALSRPQKTLRLDRKFWSGMAVQSGLKGKIYRTPMWTTRAQCGGRTSTRCHVAKAFVRQLERMADIASPYAKPYHQAPFWKFLSAWRCRSLSSTSSLFSGILCSSVQQHRRCVRVRIQKSVGNPVYSYAQISPCQIWQACLPLSYAAQIPTTPNPDLANVRASLSNLDQDVRQWSARFL